MNEIDLRPVLDAYALGSVDKIATAGGTAGKTWKITTAAGDFFLRLRGVRTSSEARLHFDHGLRRHLVEGGVPTAAALPTQDGEQWLRMDEGVYELYPFVEGRAFDPGRVEEVASAAGALARYHQVAAEYGLLPRAKEDIAQYTTLGFSPSVSRRMDDPQLQLENMTAVRQLAYSDEGRALVDWCMERVRAMQQAYGGAAYEDLTGWVIHGDYTPANLLYSDAGEVVGIFDLDWALPGARCRDVADGLYFFATRPRQIDAADIWSLTGAAQFDTERCALFLRAYQQVAPLRPEEIEALPWAFAGRWFSIRLEGMAKVDPGRRFEFFARDVEGPLRWLDEHWAGLAKGLGAAL
ncbi:MAG: phosphotransferase [Candidatus Latescibacteria bacterium]|nr:phosphotransferase [Candidatus Latescibacterota bacterium]